MSKLFRKAKNKLSWILEDITWLFFRLLLKKIKVPSKNEFTIGISTFMDRYKTCLKPLLKKVSVLFPRCQIIIIANGHVKGNQQIIYLNKIEKFCKEFSNVKLISFHKPRGLSYLWNQIIENSEYNKILILNDDIKIKMNFPKFVYSSGILRFKITTINRSWSHYFITKEIVDSIGWFDEGLQEIGGEDDDYAARLAMNNIIIENLNTKTISSRLSGRSKRLKINTFGKDMSKETGGYSSLNTEYLRMKWKTSMEYFEGAIKVPNRNFKYWKLNENFETVDKNGFIKAN